MATRIKQTSKPLYEQDFYAWSKAQAALLRAGRFADLDLKHLIEEVDDLGESLKRSVRSRLRTIIEHLLKLDEAGAASTCPACGALQARGAVFCWQCGNELKPPTDGAKAKST